MVFLLHYLDVQQISFIGYAKLYKIPKGARNVQIDEEPTGHNSNILGEF